MAEGENPTTEQQKPVDLERRLKRANKTLSQERDTLKNRLTELENEVKQAKLSAEERAAEELNKLRAERDILAAQAAKISAERDQVKRISDMVARHGLRDPEFGDVVLRQYKPDEHEDFDQFVTDIKKNNRFAVLFGVKDEPAGDEEEEIVPRPPRKTSQNNGGQKLAAAELEQEAMRLYPNDESRRKAYVANVLSLGRGR